MTLKRERHYFSSRVVSPVCSEWTTTTRMTGRVRQHLALDDGQDYESIHDGRAGGVRSARLEGEQVGAGSVVQRGVRQPVKPQVVAIGCGRSDQGPRLPAGAFFGGAQPGAQGHWRRAAARPRTSPRPARPADNSLTSFSGARLEAVSGSLPVKSWKPLPPKPRPELEAHHLALARLVDIQALPGDSRLVVVPGVRLLPGQLCARQEAATFPVPHLRTRPASGPG